MKNPFESSATQSEPFIEAQHSNSLRLDWNNEQEEDPLQPPNTSLQEEPPSPSTLRIFSTVIRAWSGFDFALGVWGIVYSLWVLAYHSTCPSGLRVVWGLQATIWITRATTALVGMYTDACQRSGLLLSSHFSAIQAMLWGVLSLTTTVELHALRHWLSQQSHYSAGVAPAVLHWLQHHIHWIPLVQDICSSQPT